MAEAQDFESEFLKSVGLEHKDLLVREMKASLATGVQVRFMTFLQTILTVIFGREMVKNNSLGGPMDDLQVHTDLKILHRHSKVLRRFVGFKEKRTNDKKLPQLLKKEENALLQKIPNREDQREYSLILSCLQKIENIFLKLMAKEFKWDKIFENCKEIRDSIRVVKKLLDDINIAARSYEKKRFEKDYPPVLRDEQKLKDDKLLMPRDRQDDWFKFAYFVQRSLLFDVVKTDLENSYPEIEKLQFIDGVSQYSDEQLAIIERLIPRLKVMVVSEIIASFNLSISKLLEAMSDFSAFWKISFPTHVQCARCGRNWVSHSLQVGEDQHEQFLYNAKCIVDWLKPWILDTQTKEQKSVAEEKPWLSVVFPGLQNYFVLVSDNLQHSCEELKKMLEEKKKLTDELAAEKKSNSLINQQLANRNQEVAELTRQVEYWKRRCEEIPPLPVEQDPPEGKKNTQPTTTRQASSRGQVVSKK